MTLAEVGDITEVIPLERVRWEGPAFRYEDRGWIYVHVEGAPYARGRQFGKLVSEEIAAYIQKLSIRRDAKDPAQGWGTLRTLADALMLRRYDPEFLEEMKGIADGAAAAGAEVHGRKVDLVDVVTMNSSIDLGQMESALPVTPSAVTGRSFLSAEDELACPTASTSARRSPPRAPPRRAAGPSSSRSSCGTATRASTSTWCSTSCPRRAAASSCRPSPAGSTPAPTST